MNDKRRIAVGYDGSADADRGLQWAIEYAKPRGLGVDVISSSGDLVYLPERTSLDAEALAQQWAQQASVKLEDSGLTDWHTKCLQGKAVPDLLDASREAALVVIGARGHGVLAGYVLGSVSQHVTRHASCPVVVVRGPRDPHARRIVVGIDGSPDDQRTLQFAFDVAEIDGATVVAVHGRNVTAINGPWDVDVAPAVAEEMERAERLLAEAVAGVSQDHPDVPVELAPMPMPASQALASASSTASLVVVGTRGRGGFVGLLLGSVSSTVLQHAQCPVAVVR